MSAIALNNIARSSRQRLAAVALMLVLATTVAVHHLSVDDMGMHAMATHSAMVVCLGVLPIVGAAFAVVLGVVTSRPRAPRARYTFPAAHTLPPPPPRARSSPVFTVVLRR